ncbi:MAG: prepilin-type N-terminal cleavage/methylation domain-containing protein [Deltaproteobacteria bacterium]|nr:MAG: prepilin-type N-terminal cleavage/methylation domain-containing protein [Deltaproteobacteria bacterium]
MRQRKRTNERGFTLLELMIGLVVMGIMIGIFAMSSTTMTSTARLRTGVRDIINLVNFARTRSAITMRAYRMQFCAANKTCAVKDKTLKDYGITNPLPRGVVFIEQCGTSKIDGSPCGDPGQSQELRYYNLQRAFRDVEILSLQHEGETKSRDTLTLYFRTDGSVSSCTTTSGIPSCVDAKYYICLRTTLDVAGSQATYIPRRLEINFDGRIKTVVDSDKKCQ